MENIEEQISLIRKLFSQEQYFNCLSECKKMQKKIKTFSYSKYTSWFCYSKMSNCYLRLNNYQLAIKYVNKAITYSDSEDESMLMVWLQSRIYSEMNDLEKANKGYDRLLAFYDKTKQDKHFAMILNNKALLNNNENMALDAIDIYKSLSNTDTSYDINNTYSNLYEIAIHNKNYLNAKEYLKNITNEDMLNELLSKQSLTI